MPLPGSTSSFVAPQAACSVPAVLSGLWGNKLSAGGCPQHVVPLHAASAGLQMQFHWAQAEPGGPMQEAQAGQCKSMVQACRYECGGLVPLLLCP